MAQFVPSSGPFSWSFAASFRSLAAPGEIKGHHVRGERVGTWDLSADADP